MSLIKSLRSKKKKMLELQHELSSADLSKLIGKKVRLTGKCKKWYEDHADQIGMPYDEMKVIVSDTKGEITRARYDKEDGFTITVNLGDFDIRVGIDDINGVR